MQGERKNMILQIVVGILIVLLILAVLAGLIWIVQGGLQTPPD